MEFMKMSVKLLAIGMLAVACNVALAEEVEKPVDQADKPARIRLYGQNGVNVKYYVNSSCIGGESVSVSGGIGDAFSSFLGTSSNKSIGIPPSPTSENLTARNGMLSKAYYREYEVAPGQPITITMRFQSNPGNAYKYCNTTATTFIPEKGKDYEAALEVTDNRCIQAINELQGTSEGTMVTPVIAHAALACS